MSSTVSRFAWNATKSKLLVSAAAAVLLAACSSESTRLADNPSDADPVYTASVPKQKAMATVESDEVISSKPLANAQVSPPKYDYSKSYKAPAYKQPSLASAPQVEIETEVSAPQVEPELAEAPAMPSAGKVTVGPGMTLYSIARSNNLSVAQLAAANGIKAPYAVHTGQQLRIPARGEKIAPRTAMAEPAAPAKPFKTGPSTPAGAANAHVVGNGDTLYSLGRKFGVSPFAIADANGLPHNTQLAIGQKVRIPGGKAQAQDTVADAAPAPLKRAASKSAANEAPAMPDSTGDEQVASADTAQAPAATSVPQAAEPATETETQVSESQSMDGTAAGMRWPVKGKVISGFGPKSNGLKNEGINIAVPEGTSVRAADSGVVAYAGNELKGYGNLVLIRHENGYVTAYAHAKELFVKRGDTVKRGDVIAKAGQTGSVSSPQLHFEVRKGATALDPIKYLSSTTASN
jgi:murein DD-endopeptidase MepM/ murein hydrolase activator NlpD